MTSYIFSAKGSWHGGWRGHGEIYTNGLHEKITIDKSMNGLGTGTNPDELLMSALCSCYMMTLGIRLESESVQYVDIKISSKGIVKKKDGLHFEEIELHPNLSLNYQPTDEQKKHIYHVMYKAEANCMIAKALKDNVKLSIYPAITIN
ncbi:OsmC family protein [Terrilactibacillus laevilacticus]|uniref:OsmC family protein n=1 Tax=Terrilactibacillus laevilacticus TaxID=1380157 RepID=A0ABW5PQJ3_9BACI|nr:OsmC family protein [Terrilactibacillus laevilacticus]